MGISTISMAIFYSKVWNYQRVNHPPVIILMAAIYVYHRWVVHGFCFISIIWLKVEELVVFLLEDSYNWYVMWKYLMILCSLINDQFVLVTGNPSIEVSIAGSNEQRVPDRQATPAHVRNWRVFEVETLAPNNRLSACLYTNKWPWSIANAKNIPEGNTPNYFEVLES